MIIQLGLATDGAASNPSVEIDTLTITGNTITAYLPDPVPIFDPEVHSYITDSNTVPLSTLSSTSRASLLPGATLQTIYDYDPDTDSPTPPRHPPGRY
jgi:hypothetical protein